MRPALGRLTFVFERSCDGRDQLARKASVFRNLCAIRSGQTYRQTQVPQSSKHFKHHRPDTVQTHYTSMVDCKEKRGIHLSSDQHP
ncbi:hypothetical protein E2C01_029164 [Portunus trituberculatus]|uniref:Uncharacterized protein n=1 Tax=Portunus trituberculatus TaxID=210409 RepID=A0A5B7ERI4_PORTR|nr:hypothetical protein [Portunus trituberculatus]